MKKIPLEPFAWKVIAKSGGLLVTVRKCVEQEEADEQLAKIESNAYGGFQHGYQDLQVVPIDHAPSHPIVLRKEWRRSVRKVERRIAKGTQLEQSRQDANYESLARGMVRDGFDFYNFTWDEESDGKPQLLRLIKRVMVVFYPDGAYVEQICYTVNRVLTAGTLVEMEQRGEVVVRRRNYVKEYRLAREYD